MAEHRVVNIRISVTAYTGRRPAAAAAAAEGRGGCACNRSNLNDLSMVG